MSRGPCKQRAQKKDRRRADKGPTEPATVAPFRFDFFRPCPGIVRTCPDPPPLTFGYSLWTPEHTGSYRSSPPAASPVVCVVECGGTSNIEDSSRRSYAPVRGTLLPGVRKLCDADLIRVALFYPLRVEMNPLPYDHVSESRWRV